jgi:hypothetical protein
VGVAVSAAATRLAVKLVAFLFQAVFLCVLGCGSGVFCHMLHGKARLWMWRHVEIAFLALRAFLCGAVFGYFRFCFCFLFAFS